MFLPLLAVLAGACVRADPIDTFANVTVYDPGTASADVSYARTLNLPNNTILATWSDFGQANGTIPIYRSTNNGFSWYSLGIATSDDPGRRLVQPHMIYVNETFGEYDTGAVLLAVNAVDSKSTNIEIYVSGDNGETFEFVSRVASGGPANTTNGATPVWEPFLLHHDHKVTVYYSDQRDAQHGQKLSHQTTQDDFDSWGSVIDDVAFPTYTDRPGMPTIAKLPNGQYIITFEYAQLLANSSSNYTYPVYYKLATSPENFASEPAHKLVVDGSARPNAGPYVTWTSYGGVNGTIVVSDSDSNPVFINQALGQGTWKALQTTAGRAYSREVQVPDNDNTKLRFACGAEFEQETPSQILVTIMDLAKALGA